MPPVREFPTAVRRWRWALPLGPTAVHRPARTEVGKKSSDCEAAHTSSGRKMLMSTPEHRLLL